MTADMAKSCSTVTPPTSFSLQNDVNPFTDRLVENAHAAEELDVSPTKSPTISDKNVGEEREGDTNEVDPPMSEANKQEQAKEKKRLSFPGMGLLMARHRTSFSGRGSHEEKEILKGMSLYFNPGELIGIMGPSGTLHVVIMIMHAVHFFLHYPAFEFLYGRKHMLHMLSILRQCYI